MPPHAMAEDAEQLPIGSSPRRGELIRVRPGETIATSDGARLELAALIERLARAQVVFIGESHAHRQHHAVQAAILEGLASSEPGGWAVGMEMFPRQKQPWLDRWSAGELEERDFVREVDWYKVWGFDWRYYREVLLVARRHRLPVVGLNLDAALVRKVGRKGIAALSAEERRSVPELDLGWSEHRRLVRALMGFPPPRGQPAAPPRAAGHHADPHRGLFDHLYEAQVLWDTGMAESAERFLEGAGRGRRLLILAGSGHVLYRLGINGRLAVRRPALEQLSVVCQSAPAERPADGAQVSAGLADLLRGTDPDGKAVEYPSLRIGLADRELRVTTVSPHSPAHEKLRPGDQLLALDGVPLADLFDLRWRLQGKDWGDEVRLRVRRQGRELTVTIQLSRPKST